MPQHAAREILRIVPLVMRSVAAELRSAGEIPAPAHFGLLTMLANQPRSLSELAHLQGVSLPTISNSVSTLVERGWVARSSPTTDRRVVIVTVTPEGTATLNRVSKAAESHIAERLRSLDSDERRQLREGLTILHRIFGDTTVRDSRRADSARPNHVAPHAV
jgi:DNA-binding MarR family transcriptional regulator